MNNLSSALLSVPGPLAYVLIALLVFSEAALFVGFVLPGETAVFMGGVLAAAGVISLPFLCAIVVAAAILGDAVGYGVGKRYGPRILKLRFLRRHEMRLDAARKRLRERGGWAVFLGRFTAFLRAGMPGLAGMSRMPWRRFAVFNAAGGITWGLGVTLLGYAAGNSYQQAVTWLGRSSSVLLGIFLIIGLVLWHRHRSATTPTPPETAPKDNGVDDPPLNSIVDTLVVIPTYNEADNIWDIVGRVRAAVPHADILIADYGSPDGTGDIAEVLATKDPHIHALHRPVKAGLGAAYLAAFGWGLERGYGVLVEMDADGSHQPEQLPQLLAGLDNGADLVLGSRWVPGGQVENWPKHRELLSRGGNAYVRIALGLPQRDATGGFRAYRGDALERIDLDGVESQGYCFQVDLVRRVVDAGLSVVEVPITFVERTKGESKMSGRIVFEALARVTIWAVQRHMAKFLNLARHLTRSAPRTASGISR